MFQTAGYAILSTLRARQRLFFMVVPCRVEKIKKKGKVYEKFKRKLEPGEIRISANRVCT